VEVADHVILIANMIFNSKDFKDSLTTLTFKNPENNCSCNDQVILHDDVVEGADAYTLLFKEFNPKLNIKFARGSRWKGLGVTPICTKDITSFIKAIQGNMKDLHNLNPASVIAVNLCHEYFHSLGYCHTYDKLIENDKRPNGGPINWQYYRDDITYRIGWIVYDILHRWVVIEKRAI